MKALHVPVVAADAADPLLQELLERAHALRNAPRFSDAELELRRVHAHESVRCLARLAVWRLRSNEGGGAAWIWPVPALPIVIANAREEVRFARRDAAPRVAILEHCATEPMEAWPAPEALAEAAFALRPCPETRLVQAFADLARGGSPRSAAIQVLTTCVRPRPRALAFGLLGFAALFDHDASGARGAFEAARRLRPADARLAWLARQMVPCSDARRDRARASEAPAGLRREFEAAARNRTSLDRTSLETGPR